MTKFSNLRKGFYKVLALSLATIMLPITSAYANGPGVGGGSSNGTLVGADVGEVHLKSWGDGTTAAVARDYFKNGNTSSRWTDVYNDCITAKKNAAKDWNSNPAHKQANSEDAVIVVLSVAKAPYAVEGVTAGTPYGVSGSKHKAKYNATVDNAMITEWNSHDAWGNQAADKIKSEFNRQAGLGGSAGIRDICVALVLDSPGTGVTCSSGQVAYDNAHGGGAYAVNCISCASSESTYNQYRGAGAWRRNCFKEPPPPPPPDPGQATYNFTKSVAQKITVYTKETGGAYLPLEIYPWQWNTSAHTYICYMGENSIVGPTHAQASNYQNFVNANVNGHSASPDASKTPVKMSQDLANELDRQREAAANDDKSLPHASVSLSELQKDCLGRGGIINVQEDTDHVGFEADIQAGRIRKDVWTRYRTCSWTASEHYTANHVDRYISGTHQEANMGGVPNTPPFTADNPQGGEHWGPTGGTHPVDEWSDAPAHNHFSEWAYYNHDCRWTSTSLGNDNGVVAAVSTLFSSGNYTYSFPAAPSSHMPTEIANDLAVDNFVWGPTGTAVQPSGFTRNTTPFMNTNWNFNTNGPADNTNYNPNNASEPSGVGGGQWVQSSPTYQNAWLEYFGIKSGYGVGDGRFSGGDLSDPYTNSRFSSLTTGFYQLLGVKCNKNDVTSLLNKVRNRTWSYEGQKDMTNVGLLYPENTYNAYNETANKDAAISAIAISPSYHVDWYDLRAMGADAYAGGNGNYDFGGSWDPISEKSKTSDFYSKECPFNCTIEDLSPYSVHNVKNNTNLSELIANFPSAVSGAINPIDGISSRQLKSTWGAIIKDSLSYNGPGSADGYLQSPKDGTLSAQPISNGKAVGVNNTSYNQSVVPQGKNYLNSNFFSLFRNNETYSVYVNIWRPKDENIITNEQKPVSTIFNKLKSCTDADERNLTLPAGSCSSPKDDFLTISARNEDQKISEGTKLFQGSTGGTNGVVQINTFDLAAAETYNAKTGTLVAATAGPKTVNVLDVKSKWSSFQPYMPVVIDTTYEWATGVKTYTPETVGFQSIVNNLRPALGTPKSKTTQNVQGFCYAEFGIDKTSIPVRDRNITRFYNTTGTGTGVNNSTEISPFGSSTNLFLSFYRGVGE